MPLPLTHRALGPGSRWPLHAAHRLISDLQTSSKLYSLARVGWKVTSSCMVSRGRIVPNPSLGWMSTNWQQKCSRAQGHRGCARGVQVDMGRPGGWRASGTTQRKFWKAGSGVRSPVGALDRRDKGREAGPGAWG